MFGLLRVVRAFCGLYFVMQVVGVLSGITMLGDTPSGLEHTKVLALLAVKAAYGALCGLLFFWLRTVINRLHEKRHGSPHPALAKGRWVL